MDSRVGLTTRRLSCSRSRVFMQGMTRRDLVFAPTKRFPRDGSGRMRTGALLVVVAVAVVAMFFNSSILSESKIKARIAGDGPKIVWGHVSDSLRNPVVGSNVVVKMKDGSTVRSTLSTTTNSAGFYTVTFDRLVWDVGNTVEVNASLGSMYAVNSTAADANPDQVVDVLFTVPIPEFSSAFVIVGAMVVLLVLLRSRIRRGL